ncbi:MAG: hypothetical protein WC497_06295, partial [Patescibacteria group bacterium]
AIPTIKGNVVVLELGDRRRRVTVRPSGTEPKIKFYVQWYEDGKSTDVSSIEARYEQTTELLENVSRELEKILFG